jgi:hypothetical protein
MKPVTAFAAPDKDCHSAMASVPLKPHRYPVWLAAELEKIQPGMAFAGDESLSKLLAATPMYLGLERFGPENFVPGQRCDRNLMETRYN